MDLDEGFCLFVACGVGSAEVGVIRSWWRWCPQRAAKLVVVVGSCSSLFSLVVVVSSSLFALVVACLFGIAIAFVLCERELSI
jgi:hypothetical protein